MTAATIAELLTTWGPTVAAFVIGVVTHRVGVVDLIIGLFKPSGQTAALLADVKSALADVQKVIADAKATAPAVPPSVPASK